MIYKQPIFITTPKGKEVLHGYWGEYEGHPCFIRKVSESDKMTIFNAWSINPEVLEKIKEKVDGLVYVQGTTLFTINISNAIEYGFEKEFAEGKTVYIPIKHWHKRERL